MGGAGGVPLVSDWCFFKGAWRIGILHFEKNNWSLYMWHKGRIYPTLYTIWTILILNEYEYVI